MSTATASMPTNKQRLTLNIPAELYEALEACAGRANRTLANQATIALEEFLLKTGDLSAPVKLALQGRPRKAVVKAPSITDAAPLSESRGGARSGAGKKRSPNDPLDTESHSSKDSSGLSESRSPNDVDAIGDEGEGDR